MNLRDEKPSRNFVVRSKDWLDVLADKLVAIGFPGAAPPAPPPPPIPHGGGMMTKKQVDDEFHSLEPYGYGVPIEVGGMWGNKPTVINGRDVFEAQYPQLGSQTPFSEEMLAGRVDRYLHPTNPGVVPDQRLDRRKWK